MESKGWAVVLGASSGFGEATALKLADRGMNICGVHLDRRGGMAKVAETVGWIEGKGVRALFRNENAADPDRRREAISALGEAAGGGPGVRVLFHSLAFGSLRPFCGEGAVSEDQMDMTLRVMAHSLVYWTRDLLAGGLLGPGAKIFAMTSSGGTRVLPAYGPVSAAKAALESHVRQLAMELAPRGIAANAVRAGVTDTPALRKIPGSDQLIANAMARNPAGRLTLPEDVAEAVAALVDAPVWLTGNVIGVDGGEDIVG